MKRDIGSIALVLKSIIKEDNQRLFITNMEGETRNSEEYYCVIIGKDQIILAERNNLAGGLLRLNLGDMNLYRNKQNVSKVFMEHFFDKVKQALDDIDSEKASVYEQQLDIEG